MKRLPEIVIFLCVTIGLLSSGTIEKKSGDAAGSDLLYQTDQDTTTYPDLLIVDSIKLELIPPSSGVHFYRNGIIFLSNTKNEEKMLPKHLSFGAIEAYFAIVKDTTLGKHKIFSPLSSFSYPCEAVTFSSDFNTMYYTKIPHKGTRAKIYQAVYKSSGKYKSSWVSDMNPMDFCAGNYTYTHPALSADGKAMIFASDRTGTLGGMDLFISRKEGNKWSAPENLGKSINTIENEFFPFLDSGSNLFFSSDGLPGYGGYDVFTCKFNGVTWDKPVNLSLPVNSEFDDIAFSIDKIDGKSAFFTTRKSSSKGEMQLFKVSFSKESANNKLLTISDFYYGKPSSKPVPAAATTVSLAKITEKKPPAGPEPKVTNLEPGAEKTKPSQIAPAQFRDLVVYRVQFFSSSRQRIENQIIINGVSYATYEYYYLDLFRYTIGEFTSLAPAIELRNRCKGSGYSDAFVVAFVNNKRTNDPNLFR